jgi:thiamine-monophosphate kinase
MAATKKETGKRKTGRARGEREPGLLRGKSAQDVAETRPLSEFTAIDVLTRVLNEHLAQTRVTVGFGDDAAVLGRPEGELVCTVDASLEGVHFDLRWLSLEHAARRAFHAAVSDIAAMGAKPLVALVALEVPPHTAFDSFAAIARGQARAVRETGCPIVGGNVSRGRGFGFTTTALGTCRRGHGVTRRGAKPGDEVWLSHDVGWAGLGLRLLQSGAVVFREGRYRCVGDLGRDATFAARRWSAPQARVSTGMQWASRVHAMIDISDSLASETRHLAQASQVALVLDAKRMRDSHRRVWRTAQRLGRDPLHSILYSGEEYALLATGPSRNRPDDALVIGAVEEGSGAFITDAGKRSALHEGFDHLTSFPEARR